MKKRWYRALLMELLVELRKRFLRATTRKSSPAGAVSQGRRAAGSADVEGDVWPPAAPSWAQEEDAVERAGSAAAPRARRRETLERL